MSASDVHHAIVLVILALVVVRWLRRRGRRDTGPKVAAGPVAARSFGYKGAWLAVRSGDPLPVARELGLVGVQSVDWREGMALASADRSVPRAFLTPSVDGWVLVAFSGEPPEAAESGAILERLSRLFGEAQRFASHRVVSYVEWQRYVDGAALRRYAYDGSRDEVLLDAGRSDPLEPADPFEADEETVIELARSWSVDPTALDDREHPSERGLIGARGA
jgi:hypothetical protein